MEKQDQNQNGAGLSRSHSSAGSVYFALEGEFKSHPNNWREIEKSDTLSGIKSDEEAYRGFMDETNWRDFRIVRVTTTREILLQNKQLS